MPSDNTGVRWEGWALVEDGEIKCCSTVCDEGCPNRPICKKCLIFIYPLGKEGE